MEEESNVSVSTRKLCSEIDSEDLTEKRNYNVVDINLLNGANLANLAIARCFVTNSKSAAAAAKMRDSMGFVCENANCSLIQMIG